ncbi:MAG: hypothetical protein WCW27_04775 [Patescibacteria group bacterium]|jgi:hypothetical protein
MLLKKIALLIKEHKYIICLCVIASAFLLWLNPLIWPVNDEYLYADIGKAIHKSLTTQQILLSDINTEHTPLLTFLVAGYTGLTSSNSIWELRFISIIFAVASIIIYYCIFLKIGFKKLTAIATLSLLFLITDFWIYAVRLTLVMPSVFCYSLLLYLLLNNASKIKVGITVFILFLFNEYYFYLAFGLLIVYSIFNILLPSKQSRRARIWQAIHLILITAVPTTIMIFFLLDFNLLPYPRLLENSLKELFSDSFLLIHKQIAIWLAPVIERINISYTDIGSTITTSTPIIDKVNQISTTGNIISNNIINSPIQERTTGIINKLTYNFSDTYLHPLILVFASFGLLQRIKFIWQQHCRLELVRTDLIMFLLTALFVFFNIQQGGTEHGFRILMPMIPGLLYFTYHGLKRTLYYKCRSTEYALLAILFIGQMAIYYYHVHDYQYKNVLGNISLLVKLIQYKSIIFISIFGIAFVFILLYYRLHLRYKPALLALLIIGFWGLKFIPYYQSNQLNTQYFGYEHGFSDARPYLESIKDEKIITNLYYHKSYYLSDNIFVPNAGAAPTIRTFSKIYQNNNYNLGEHFESNVIPQAANDGAGYVFVFQEFYGKEYTESLQNFLQQYQPYLTPIKVKTIQNNYQWGLYRFDYELFNKKSI